MKRKLDKQELEMEKIGLERNKKELKALMENLEYNADLIEKQKYLRAHDDRWRDFLRKQKDKEDDDVIEAINREIKIKGEMIAKANEHIKEGVEVKNAAGVA